MKRIYSRRYRPRASVNCEGKKGCHENFFGDPEQDLFFQPSIHSTQEATIHRKCAECEKEDKQVRRAAEEKNEEQSVHRMEDKKEEKPVQRMEGGVAAGAGTAACGPMSMGGVSRYISSLPGKGVPLPATARRFFEARMGHDFSEVRIHTGEEAARSAREVRAKAYTTGNDIVFNEGQYDHSTGEGKKLLAHELAHVVQQERMEGRGAGPDRKIDRRLVDSTPRDSVNLAQIYVEATEKGADTGYFGETTPFINGTNMTTSSNLDLLHLPGESDIQTVETPAQDKDHPILFHSTAVRMPDNVTSYTMVLPSKSGWRFETDRSKMESVVGHSCSTSRVTAIVKGDPSDTAVHDNTLTHENVHVDHIRALDTQLIEGFASDALRPGQGGVGTSAAASRAALLAGLRILGRAAVHSFGEGFKQRAGTFHGQAAGAKGNLAVTHADCMYIRVKASNP